MKTMMTQVGRSLSAISATALVLLLGACGGDAGSGGSAAQPGAAAGQPATAQAGGNSQGPDTSQLGQIVLDKINQDPTRMELKVTGKLVEFNVVSSKTEVFGEMGAATVVECAGVVVFDGDVHWSWKDTEPRKAGEQAKLECRAEYVKQDSGWQLTPPLGIYPL